VRYPTRALLRCLNQQPPGTAFWLPDLTAEDAWRLSEFLDDIQKAIWMDYGDTMVAYRQSMPFPDLDPPPDAEATGIQHGMPDDLPF
jgi:hypothetical protein